MRSRLLFVDDEAHVLDTLVDIWSDEFDVDIATSGADGLAIMQRVEPDVVVSDMRMPGMDGASFLAATREVRPDAVRILLTGQADADAAARAINLGGIFKLLAKPCPHDVMQRAIREALAVRARARAAHALTHQLVHAEQLATLGTMSASIGHELNNTLTVMGFAIDCVERDAATATATSAEIVTFLVDGFARLKAQARTTTDLARRSDQRPVRFALAPLIESLVSAIKIAGIGKRATIGVDIEPTLAMDGDRTQVEQVMLNLVKNSLDALPNGLGRVNITAISNADTIELVVTDSGSGIAPEHLATVFEPYFTTKPRGVGTGLGLPVVKQIVESYGGSIRIDSTIGQGTRVTITFPDTIARERRRVASQA